MPDKIKIAVSWAAACGGCDVSLLDIEETLLDVAELADFVYWPVAMDFKRDGFLALPPGSVDVGLFNGAIRTTEQYEDALAFRERCRIVVAYGACAAFGGIPGLANLTDSRDLLDVAYERTPSTENPDRLRPQTEHHIHGHTLTLPGFHDRVRSLDQVIEVDWVLPGCPPPTSRILELVAALAQYARDGTILPKGTVLASPKALCDACPRVATRTGRRMTTVVRPHEVVADPSVCFLEQGILCMGISTRGGCGATCVEANMPCRGCFGPTPHVSDPATFAISAIGSIAGAPNENDVPAHQMKAAVRSVQDPAGTFCRFTLPTGFIGRAVSDQPQTPKPTEGKR